MHSRSLAGYCLMLLLAGLGACSTTHMQDRGSYLADDSHRAVSSDSRVKHLVFHYTVGGMPGALSQLSGGPVSAHYLVTLDNITEGGRAVVLQLVPEDQRAWHAGVSYWQGRTNLNDSSIGIEIVNRGYLGSPSGTAPPDGNPDSSLGSADNGIGQAYPWAPYTPAQIGLIKRMAADIIARHKIIASRVLGHSDIAPSRKTDPGPLFPWKELAEAGIGAWPDATTVQRYLAGRLPQQPVADVGLLQALLRQYGYEVALTGQLDPQTVQVLRAFQMHFRAANYNGAADAETQAILQALLEKYFIDEE